MLQLDRVDVCYGSFKALTQVSMTVGAGELVVLLGANGAGKTTLFNTISGLLKPTTGTITLEGKRIDGLKPSALVAAGVVHCPEGRKLFPQMSVSQNLALGAYLHRRDGEGNKRNQPAGSLSGGQQQMVAIGRALMSRPRLLMLDEPSLGLAPLVVNQMFEVISRINGSGTSVLLAEQNAFAALKIAHRAYVIEGGSLVMEGDQQAMLGNEAVRKAYIGA